MGEETTGGSHLARWTGSPWVGLAGWVFKCGSRGGGDGRAAEDTEGGELVTVCRERSSGFPTALLVLSGGKDPQPFQVCTGKVRQPGKWRWGWGLGA